MITELDITRIEPSPYQHRVAFSPKKLQELADSIKRDGLVQPIVVRPQNGHYELIAGERRWRAGQLAGLDTILSRVVEASDHQARRMCATENLQREDLSAIEELNAIIEMLDAELIEDETYAAFGYKPVDRVKWLLMKLDSDRRTGTDYFSNKFIGKINIIFSNLPKPKEWLSFYNNDFRNLINIDADVAAFAAQNKLNKSQTIETQKLKDALPQTFEDLKRSTNEEGEAVANITVGIFEKEQVEFKDLSSREIADMRRSGQIEYARRGTHNLAITPPLPAGKYRCIILDPPWPMQKIEREERPNQGLELDYPTMTLEEIEALPIQDLADESGCHLYLWVTQKYLPFGLSLVEAWGFNYQCLMTWKKNVGITPYSWMYDTEHVIFARRGNLPLQQLGLRLSFEASVNGHSVKPDIFFEGRVKLVSPEPRLEMFARKQREGFEVWGNEV